MGNNRYGSDTRLRYTVIAPLRGACSSGCSDAKGVCTRTFKLYFVHTAWKKTTACFSMDGKGTHGMVLTECSVPVCLNKIGGYNIYGQ